MSGTLTANSESSTPLEFVSCLEDGSNLAKADSQVDGNWYSWYSATAGSEPKDGSGNTQWSGGLAPDSICPKGWQLPTYSGDKSFTTLINTSYSMKDGWQTTETSFDAGVLSNPLSFLRGGMYDNASAISMARNSSGLYWSLRSHSLNASNNLNFNNISLVTQNPSNRGAGFAVRFLQILHYPH